MNKLSEYTWKICVIGSGSVGKTSLIHRCIDNKFQDSYNETIGIDLFSHSFNNIDYQGQQYDVSLLIYDLGGQDYWKKLRADFYHRSKGVVFVYDVSRPETFEALDSWYTEAIENIGHDVPCIILGNKHDLENKIPKELFKSVTTKFNFKHYYVSAKTGESVIDAFKQISKEILEFNS